MILVGGILDGESREPPRNIKFGQAVKFKALPHINQTQTQKEMLDNIIQLTYIVDALVTPKNVFFYFRHEATSQDDAMGKLLIHYHPKQITIPGGN